MRRGRVNLKNGGTQGNGVTWSAGLFFLLDMDGLFYWDIFGQHFCAQVCFAILIWKVHPGKEDVSATTTLAMPKFDRMPRRIPQGNQRYCNNAK